MKNFVAHASMALVLGNDYYQQVDLEIPKSMSYKRMLNHDNAFDYYYYDSYYVDGLNDAYFDTFDYAEFDFDTFDYAEFDRMFQDMSYEEL